MEFFEVFLFGVTMALGFSSAMIFMVLLGKIIEKGVSKPKDKEKQNETNDKTRTN